MKKRYMLYAGFGLVGLAAAAAIINENFRTASFRLADEIYSRVATPTDPLTRAIDDGVNTAGGGWGYLVALTPKPLALGERRANVDMMLRKGKYLPEPDSRFFLYASRPITEGSSLYAKTVDVSPCRRHYEVGLSYDSQGRLRAAEGTVSEAGCL